MIFDREYHRQWCQDHKESVRISHKKYLDKKMLERPQEYLHMRIKHRAKNRGNEFNLEPSDFIIPEKCPILDIPLAPLGSKRCAGSLSIDRHDNTKGYVKGNVRVISWKANKLKADMDIPTVERLLAYMKETR